MKILLISGHAGTPYDPGATATIDGVYHEEAKLNIEVVDRLEKILRDKYGQSVTVYDRARDAYKDYKNGVLVGTANFKAYDYVLEIHFNACVKDYSGNGYTTGTEIYYPSRGSKSGAENAILKHVCALGFRNRGAMPMALAVINTAAGQGVKANLLEVCFIDDADDVRLYLKKKDAIAEAIAAGVAEAFDFKKKEDKPVDNNPSEWAKEAWEWAKSNKITDGTNPKNTATRQEVIAFLYRYHKMMEGK